MTVSTEISSNEYTGNGVTTDFDYKFRIFKANQLSVITSDADGDNVVTLRLGTDYTVTGANKSAGGKVILTRPLADKHKISIARDIPITQETSFRNQSKFFAETHENAFDYLTMILQRIWGSLGSLYLKRPNILANWFDAKGYRIANLGKPKRDSDAVDLGTLNDEISDVNSTILKREKRLLRVDDMDIATLPKASDRAGNVLTFDKDGKPIVVAPASGSAVDVLNQLAISDGELIGAGSNKTLKDRLEILPAMSTAVYIDKFMNATASFSHALQAAIDSIDADDTGKYSSKIIIPRGRFRVTESVFFYEKDGLHLQGAGDGATILEVDTILNTPLPFEFQAINGKYKGYTYNENAVFIIAARRVTQIGGSSGMHGKGNGAAWRVKFSDFKIEATGDAYRKTQGIYSPEVGLSDFKDITTHGLHSTITAADLYVVTGENIYMFDCDYPIKHGIGVNAQGTTLNMVNCVASKVKYGWYFSKLSYSSFQNIAIDGWGDGHTGANISAFAYRFDKCDIVMNGCGCESVAGTSFGVFNIFNGSSIVLNGGNYWGGNVSDLVSAQSFVADAGTVLTINGPWWRQGANRDSQLPVSVTNGAVINIIGLSKMNVTAGASLRISDFVNDGLSEVNAIGKNNYVYAANRNSDITSTERTFNVPFTTETIDTLSAINEYPTSALNVVSAGRYRVSACLPIDHSSQLSVSLLVDGIAQYAMPITNNAVAILNCIVICKYKSTIRIVLNDANGVTVKSGSFVNIEKI